MKKGSHSRCIIYHCAMLNIRVSENRGNRYEEKEQEILIK